MKHFLILVLLSANICFGQTFKWQAQVENVKTNGFYNILLNHEITSKLLPEYSDLRLFDKENNEVPYLLTREAPVSKQVLFKEYEIISKQYNKKGGFTRLVIHNPKKTNINNIVLQIRNADVHKWLCLNASDDNRNWFALKDKYFFESFVDENNTNEIQILNFPLSNYAYYELLVYDYLSEPIDILKAGFYDIAIENGKYTESAQPHFKQDDKSVAKTSIIKIAFAYPVYIDKIELEIEHSTFFRRNVTFNSIDTSQKEQRLFSKKTNALNQAQLLNSIVSSNSRNVFYFNSLKTSLLELQIQNNDDKPIKIKNIKAFQLNSYIVAKLKNDNAYILKFGSNECQAPVYDLAYFRDSIPANLSFLKLSNIHELNAEAKNNQQNNSKTVYIWIALAIVVSFLLFMTFKMVNEMKRKNNEI